MPGKAKKPAGPTKVEATEHPGDTRLNIPTAELESFAVGAEEQPTKLLYPRDPSLDPQLVWKGKDEQDRTDLEVPAVPVYIQETIEPRALIEDLRAGSRERGEEQMGLFAGPFEGMSFEDRVDFYQHEGTWTNRMILGDSLLVMASLAEKEGLKGKVQMIYMDPPYGIKFGSNWQVSTRRRDVKDGRAEDVTRQPEQVKAFRDTWDLGVHSYLDYLRDRLKVARDLLAESGSLFVQIGDENVHLVRSVLDEVFRSSSFVGAITFKKTSSASGDGLAGVVDYILWYAKNRERLKYRQLYHAKSVGGLGGGQYTWLETASGDRHRASPQELQSAPPGCRFFTPDQLTSQRPAQGVDLRTFRVDGHDFTPGQGTFKTDERGMSALKAARRLLPIGNTLRYVRYMNDFPAFPLTNLWDDTVTSGFADAKTYVVQTNPTVVERCVLMTTDPGDLVVDPTCGSGTTAFVAEEWGRRWITVDTSRVAMALARTRLMSARYPYYLLADSSEGAVKKAEVAGTQAPSDSASTRDVKKGFIYESIPHVTLKSIVQNPDIHEGMTREEIDGAVARHAETEILYDRPYTDPKVVRVSGPFTVESLSPHRALAGTGDSPDPEPVPAVDAGRFIEQVIAELRNAGVQNTVKDERLHFDRLEAWPGVYIHAAGEYTEDGKSRTVAVCVGPEHGTVGPQLVNEARRVWLRLRRLRGGDQRARQAQDPAGEDEPRPADAGPAQEDRRRQPVHGLRRTGHRHPVRPRGHRRGRDPRPGRLRPDHRRRAEPLDRRHRLLVHRHGLQRRELLRAARLLPRRRRSVRAAPQDAPSRD
jgi:adenine-specific DNA-methyltransferase